MRIHPEAAAYYDQSQSDESARELELRGVEDGGACVEWDGGGR